MAEGNCAIAKNYDDDDDNNDNWDLYGPQNECLRGNNLISDT